MVDVISLLFIGGPVNRTGHVLDNPAGALDQRGQALDFSVSAAD